MDSIRKSPRVLIVPVDTQGHWTPVLQLMQQLVWKKIDFTVCTTAQRCDELRSYEAKGAFGTLEVEFMETFIASDPALGLPHLLGVIKKDLETCVANRRLDTSRFTCMICDIFLFFCQDMADQWGIPVYTLLPSTSYCGLMILQAADLIRGGWTPYNLEKKDEFIQLPGLEMFTASDISTTLVDWEPFQQIAGAIRRASGFLINSFEEFDMNSINNLRIQLQSNPIPGKVPPKVFPIGPLLFLPGFLSLDEKLESAKKHETIVWLDKQPKSSVLFICFGSLKPMFKDLSLAIAKALEDCGVPFLWVMRVPPQGSRDELLPHGFEERTQDQGLVVSSWVPQQEILKHPSIGGFISHCGWNSILESLLGGVPIAGYPMYAEQRMNARYLATAFETSLLVDVKAQQFDSQGIAAAITKLMKGQEGIKVKLATQDLKEKAHAAVAEGGSSYRHWQDFLSEISQPMIRRT